MAEVWEAVDRRLERPVAVKLFAGDALGEDMRARFLREARLAARFAHRHAIAVYDTGEDDGALYLVMELVDGPTLADVLAERGRLDPDEAVEIAHQILGAVAAGHRAGLVHRDIKPSNILFTSHGEAKLADFGIAKGVGDLATHLTADNQVVGTPRYLSPEQAAGKDATPASDLYGIGVVLFEMLSGTPPFVGDTPVATAAAHRHARVPSLLERRPDLDPDLAAVVERALAKAPGARYVDVAAMRRALASPGTVVGRPAVASAPATGAAAAQTVAGASGTRAAAASAPGPVQAETGVLRTRPLHASPARPATSRLGAAQRGSVAVLATLGVLLVGAVAAAAMLIAGGGGDVPPGSQAAPDVSASTTTTTTPSAANRPDSTTTTTAAETTTTTAPDTTSTQAQATQPTIAGLTATLAQNPDAYGKKADDLLDKIQTLQREGGDKRAEKARDQLKDVSKWTEKGELDPQIAGLAAAVLTDMAES
jgi:serine/threonine-protein kinase